MGSSAPEPGAAQTALVLFSGGQDSSVCLAWALAATWGLAGQLGSEALTSPIVEHSHTCYLGDRGARHA